jgi:hypothetical protein
VVGQSFPQPAVATLERPQPERHEPCAAKGSRATWLSALAALSVAALFATFLLVAAILDARASQCDAGVMSETCCVAASADAFSRVACRELR